MIRQKCMIKSVLIQYEIFNGKCTFYKKDISIQTHKCIPRLVFKNGRNVLEFEF